MGKMKEVFQAMKDENWQGTAEEYLKWWVKKQALAIEKKEKDEKNNKKKK